ncbi:hypothetical protein P8452_60128 [Trifolium repens]|nr:hypothetical protein P8452_60128 [Trifolium repens]
MNIENMHMGYSTEILVRFLKTRDANVAKALKKCSKEAHRSRAFARFCNLLAQFGDCSSRFNDHNCPIKLKSKVCPPKDLCE